MLKRILLPVFMALVLLPAGSVQAQARRSGAVNLKDFRAMWEELDRKVPKSLMKARSVNWAGVKKEFERKVYKARSTEEFVKLCMEALGRLRDGHSYLRCESIPSDKLYDRNAYYNPGAGLVECADGSMAVLRVYAKSPAEQAGLKPGMVVVSIDGKDAKTVAKKAGEARWTRGYISSARAARHNAIWTLLSGYKDSRVKLKVKDSAGKTRSVSLKRSFSRLLRCPKMYDYPAPEGLKRQGRVYWTTLEKDFGYIYLIKFDGRDGGKAIIEKALAEFKEAGIKGLVVDVRGNGGGGVPSVDWPVELPVVLAIDPGTFSAGEGFAAYFGWSRTSPKGHPKLFIIGQGTAGSSSQKATGKVPSGLFTFYYSVRGRKGAVQCGPGGMIEFYGITPHEKVLQKAEDLAQGKDTVILRAVEILKQKSGK